MDVLWRSIVHLDKPVRQQLKLGPLSCGREVGIYTVITKFYLRAHLYKVRDIAIARIRIYRPCQNTKEIEEERLSQNCDPQHRISMIFADRRQRQRRTHSLSLKYFRSP
jgi:hypothetical protein